MLSPPLLRQRKEFLVSDPSLERLAGVVFATMYPYRTKSSILEVTEESARIAVSIRAHLNALTRRPDDAPVVPTKF